MARSFKGVVDNGTMVSVHDTSQSYKESNVFNCTLSLLLVAVSVVCQIHFLLFSLVTALLLEGMEACTCQRLNLSYRKLLLFAILKKMTILQTVGVQ